MSSIRCDHQDSVVDSRCRKRARVRVVYVNLDDRGRQTLGSSTDRCWEHYLELENLARTPGATFRILKSVIL